MTTKDTVFLNITRILSIKYFDTDFKFYGIFVFPKNHDYVLMKIIVFSEMTLAQFSKIVFLYFDCFFQI